MCLYICFSLNTGSSIIELLYNQTKGINLVGGGLCPGECELASWEGFFPYRIAGRDFCCVLQGDLFLYKILLLWDREKE